MTPAEAHDRRLSSGYSMSGTRASSEYEHRLQSLDLDLFSDVPSETSLRDRRSLLSLYNACRESFSRFAYLEIGSHLGGTLQVLLRDERCNRIISVDSRPESQPDNRGRRFAYPGNTSQRMLDHLQAVPDARLEKISCIEASTQELSLEEFRGTASLCFIDGEHTNEAVLRDARFCAAVVNGDGAIVFHDRRIVRSAIAEFLSELEGYFTVTAYSLPDALFVVELGDPRLARSRWISQLTRAGEDAPV